MKYRPVRQHRQLRPRWDRACSSANPLPGPARRFSRAPTPGSRTLVRQLARSLGQPSTSLFLSSGSCLLLVFPARFLDSSSTLAAWRLPHERGFRWSFPGLTISICRPEGRRAELIRTAESRRWCRSERRLVLSFDPISVLSLSPFRSPARSSPPPPPPPPPSPLLFLPPALNPLRKPAPSSSHLFLSLFSSRRPYPSSLLRAARCRKSVAPGLPRINETIRRGTRGRMKGRDWKFRQVVSISSK